jgi:hypothetical protein
MHAVWINCLSVYTAFPYLLVYFSTCINVYTCSPVARLRQVNIYFSSSPVALN